MKSDMVEALVQAGAEETQYVRAGSGQPVVLLLRASSSPSAIMADPLFTRLSREFRVVAPAVPSDRELTCWVGDLVDGLGLDRPAIVVDAELSRATIPLAVEADRFCCIIVLHGAPDIYTAQGMPHVAPASPAAGLVSHGDDRAVQYGVWWMDLCVGASGGLDHAKVDALVTFLRKQAR